MMRLHRHMDNGRLVWTDGAGYDCPPERRCWQDFPDDVAHLLKESVEGAGAAVDGAGSAQATRPITLTLGDGHYDAGEGGMNAAWTCGWCGETNHHEGVICTACSKYGQPGAEEDELTALRARLDMLSHRADWIPPAYYAQLREALLKIVGMGDYCYKPHEFATVALDALTRSAPQGATPELDCCAAARRETDTLALAARQLLGALRDMTTDGEPAEFSANVEICMARLDAAVSAEEGARDDLAS